MKSEFLLVLLYLIVIVAVIGYITQVIWNSVISDIFSLRNITYIEAVVLNVFFRLSFQSFDFNSKE